MRKNLEKMAMDSLISASSPPNDDCFSSDFPMLYTDFDLLTDFPEPTLDFLADIPEEKLLLPFPTGSPEECPFDTEVALSTRWQHVDDFFQDITELFQIDLRTDGTIYQTTIHTYVFRPPVSHPLGFSAMLVHQYIDTQGYTSLLLKCLTFNSTVLVLCICTACIGWKAGCL
jgi:hypothetical protein